MFKSVYKSIKNDDSAVLISFFGGKEYYYDAGIRLAKQCKNYNLSYDICEYIPSNQDDWKSICKKKINFYLTKLEEHKRAIFWIDVDSQIISNPTTALRSTADFAAFLRNFKYLVGFDPYQFARLFHPGYLYFAYNDKVLGFVKKLQEISKNSPEQTTDDFVLQECLVSFEQQLRIEIYSPELIVTSNESTGREKAVFQHSDSGNVQMNTHLAVQHDPEILSVDRQKRVLNEAIKDCLRNGNLVEASIFLKRIRKIAPDDRDSLLKLLSLYDRLGDESKYKYHLDKAKKNPITRNAALRADIEKKLSSKKYDNAERSIEQLLNTAEEEDRNFVASRTFRYDLNRRAESSGIPENERVRLWWWEQPYPGNLGDIINPYVVEKLTGLPPLFETKLPRVLAIGSIIKFARKGDIVWGSGAPSEITPINTDAEFRAVRGPLTRDLIVNAGGKCEPIYGDPAWLLPLIYNPKNQKKTHRIGLIRHWVHERISLPIDEDVKEISIVRCGYGDIENFINEMLACEHILSTSLHGLIIANAYGIPAKLCTISDSARQIHGDGIKFLDYFMSIGLKEVNITDLNRFSRVDSNLRYLCTDNPEKLINLKELLEVAPFNANIKL